MRLKYYDHVALPACNAAVPINLAAESSLSKALNDLHWCVSTDAALVNMHQISIQIFVASILYSKKKTKFIFLEPCLTVLTLSLTSCLKTVCEVSAGCNGNGCH